MWIFNWFKQTLFNLGLANKKGKIIFLGLDDAGKTTLLLMLKDNIMRQIDPTQKPHTEQLVLDKIKFRVTDLGGHEAARKTWKNYMMDIDGLVYLIDSSNPKRFEESFVEFSNILEMPQLENVPILVFGNKIDKKGAVSFHEICEVLQLPSQAEEDLKGKRPIKLFMVSLAKKMGYAQGFRWLSQFLK